MRWTQGRQRKLIYGLLIPVLTGSAVGCGGSEGGGGAVAEQPSCHEAASGQRVGREKAEEIEAFGRVEFPTSFTGVRRVEGVAEVYRVSRPGRDLDRAVAKEFPGARIAFCDVPRSEPQLRALDQEIHDDLAWQEKQDITIAWATLDARRGMVKVAVPNPDKVRSRIVGRYGDGVFVVQGEVVPVEAASLR